MKHKYILTGYLKDAKRIRTYMFYDINKVFEIMTHYSKDMPYKSAADLDFDVQSQSSHNDALIIDDSIVAWSVFYV